MCGPDPRVGPGECVLCDAHEPTKVRGVSFLAQTLLERHESGICRVHGALEDHLLLERVHNGTDLVGVAHVDGELERVAKQCVVLG